MNEAPEHVLFIVNSYPPRVGGLENHVASLAARLVETGHRATVVTLDNLAESGEQQGVSILRLPGRFPIASVISFPSMGTAKRIVRSFEHEGVTAVSTHTRFFPMSSVGLTVARKLGVPLIHTEHGSAHVRGVSPIIRLASRMVDATLGRSVLRGATRVLAVSEEVADFVKRLAGVPSVLFYNAINPFEAHSDPLDDAKKFVFVGRIVPGKGWDDLLDATSMVRDALPALQFTVEILGDGPDLPRLTRRVEELGLGSIVSVRGRVSQSSVYSTLRCAVLVNPTRLAEGFQTTLLEALASGGQIVTYPAPGVERLRLDGAPVWIAERATIGELADLMIQSQTRALPTFAAERLTLWTWPERARQYLGILASLRG